MNIKRWWSWWTQSLSGLVAEVRHRWYWFIALALIWALALVRLFVYQVPVLPIMFNWTPSIPYRMVYVDYGPHSLQRGDFIVYRFANPAAEQDYPGLKGQPFFKRVVGLPGDKVTVVDRNVFVNGLFVGYAKPYTFDHRPLEPLLPIVIPMGQLYVQGTSADSFDSRYRNSGLVDEHQVQAKVHPIF